MEGIRQSWKPKWGHLFQFGEPGVSQLGSSCWFGRGVALLRCWKHQLLLRPQAAPHNDAEATKPLLSALWVNLDECWWWQLVIQLENSCKTNKVKCSKGRWEVRTRRDEMPRLRRGLTKGSTVSDLGFPVGPTNGEDKVTPEPHSAARAEGPQGLGKDVIPMWECTVRKRGKKRGELKREWSEAGNYMGKYWRNSARVFFPEKSKPAMGGWCQIGTELIWSNIWALSN